MSIRRIGSYLIEEVLFESKNSYIYQVEHADSKEKYILKVIHSERPSPSEVARFNHEYKINQLLNEVEGVVTVVASEEVDNHLLMCMEYNSAYSLDKLYEESIPINLFLKLAISIVKVLSKVHDCQVIHNDINPRNILWSQEEEKSYLIDFGISSEISMLSQATGVDNLEGSLPYISPEQTGRMNRNLDYRSDYYSLGVTFYYLLSGKLPFHAEDPLGWIHCHVAKQAPSILDFNPKIPGTVAKIVEKLMNKNAEDRYSSGFGLLYDLEACQKEYSESGKISDFKLGTKDVSRIFQISNKLYGRDSELDLLMRVFSVVRGGGTELILVKGYSGIGKSQLVHEIHKPIVDSYGVFIEGKFSQFHKGVAYSALRSAFQQMAAHILNLSEHEIEKWKSKVLKSLGKSGSIITNLVPEMEAILGKQPELEAVAVDQQEEDRFFHIIRSFVRNIASKERPVVLFLDDLQWADEGTLKLISDWLIESIPHLLIIGAYRSNEVDALHPLSLQLEKLEKKKELHKIDVGALKLDDVKHMVADTLYREIDECDELSDLIQEKARGNPFFIRRIFEQMFKSSSIFFDTSQGKWMWKLDEIKNANIADNVVELLLEIINNLEEGPKSALHLSSFLGHVFSLDLLSYILDKTPFEAHQLLVPSIKEGMLKPINDNYKYLSKDSSREDDSGIQIKYSFQHDRVQQGAYEAESEEKREKTHLTVGRLLLKFKKEQEEKGISKDYDASFVEHFNKSRNLITDHQEKAISLELNYNVAKTAFASAAYHVSLEYTSLALYFVSEDAWKSNYEQTFGLYLLHAECAYLSKHIEDSDKSFGILLKESKLGYDRAKVYQKLAMQKYLDTNYEESLDLTIKGLEILGYKINKVVSKARLILHIIKAQILMKKYKKAEDLLSIPESKDKSLILTHEMIAQCGTTSYNLMNNNLLVDSLLLGLELSLTKGRTSHNANWTVAYACIIVGMFDQKKAYDLCKVGFKLFDMYGNPPSMIPSSITAIVMCWAWNEPWEKITDYCMEVLPRAIETAQLHHVGFSICNGYVYHPSMPVDKKLKKLGKLLPLTKSYRGGYLMSQFCYQFLKSCLEETFEPGSLSDNEFDEEAVLKELIEAKTYGFAVAFYYVFKIKALVMCHNYDKALEFLTICEPYHEIIFGSPLQTEYYFGRFLVYANHPELYKKTKSRGSVGMKTSHAFIKKAAANYAHNFNHYLYIMEGEQARIKGDLPLAIEKFEQAALAAKKSHSIYHEGLANELLASTYSLLEKNDLVRFYINEAYYFYELGKYAVKTKFLRDKYPEQFISRTIAEGDNLLTTTFDRTTHSDTTSGGFNLDLDSIAKASQSISSEVDLGNLLTQLMNVVQENAGSDKSILLLVDGDKLLIEAETITAEKTEILAHKSYHDYKNIPKSIINYVYNSKKLLLKGNVTEDNIYGNDPYIKDNKVSSVLCMPSLNRGKLIGVLYLENNLLQDAFTEDRVRTLNMLISQAAISIENAKLYSSLEQKVKDRTAKLQEKTDDINDMLQNMQQGIFTILEDETIHHEYSAYLESIFHQENLAGKDAMEFLFSNSVAGEDLISRTKAALDAVLGDSSFVFEINAHLFLKDYSRTHRGKEQLLELDWLPLIRNEVVEKVMVVVRDVTEVRALEKQAETQKKELGMIGEIIRLPQATFMSFIKNSSLLFEDNKKIIEKHSGNLEDVNIIFRNMHTVKGNARMWNLKEATDKLHEVEQTYDKIRKNKESWDTEKLLLELNEANTILDNYKRLAIDQLHYKETEDEATDIDNLVSFKNRFLSFVNSIKGENQGDIGGKIRDLSNYLSELEYKTLESILENLVNNLPSTARAMDKESPKVEFHEITKIYFLKDIEQLLVDVFMHCLRNSVDHGIELPEQRKIVGKDPVGNIYINSDLVGDEILLEIHDDGAGLNLGRLREIRGQEDTDENLGETIFKSGVSTASSVSDISGRGVGMDAVRATLREKGGDIHIKYLGEEANGFRPFSLVITLPRSFCANVDERKNVA